MIAFILGLRCRQRARFSCEVGATTVPVFLARYINGCTIAGNGNGSVGTRSPNPQRNVYGGRSGPTAWGGRRSCPRRTKGRVGGREPANQLLICACSGAVMGELKHVNVARIGVQDGALWVRPP